MKKRLIIIILSLALFTFACGGNTSKEEKTDTDSSTTTKTPEEPEGEVKATEPRGTIYRSDGFRNGIVSEWIQVAYDDTQDEIAGIWYWNTSDETKVQLKVIKATFSQGEISGVSGKLKFPSDDEEIGFGMIEDRFNLSYSDERFQEFEHEDSN
jgi:hypothetical protein